jgi:pyruvate dehydrogenase E1 component alpha subunit
MLLIRRFEETVERLFAEGRIHGTTHLCIGQEACAVGACDALASADLVVSTHRGHGHLLARGGDPRRMMAELFGKAEGYSKGRGGSQHMACREIGFLGTTGITGGGLPIATGAALALQLQRLSAIVLCFFGDGASNQGTFHESLNLASIWKLPVLFFCENNLYAMSTPVSDAMAVENVADRAAAYKIPAHIVDGNDSFAVRDAAYAAAAQVRAGHGPQLIEAKTYRLRGHSKSDPREYRSRKEEQAWEARDPLRLLSQRIVEGGLAAKADLETIADEVNREIEQAVDFATKCTPATDPGTASLFA